MCSTVHYTGVRPRQYELVTLLSSVSHQWEEIGVLLGVAENVIGELRISNSTALTKLARVLESWLKDRPTAVNWKTILRLLEETLDNKRLCVRIKEYLGYELEKETDSEYDKRETHIHKVLY